MMKRFAPLALLTLFAIAPSEARAQWFDVGAFCSLGSIKTCASFQVQTQDLGARTQVYIRARNVHAILSDGSEGGSTLTRLGVLAPDLENTVGENAGSLGGGETIFTEAGATASGDDPAGEWKFRKDLNSLGKVEWGLSSGNPEGGIQDCTGPAANPSKFFSTCVGGAPDGWVTFAFSTTSTVAAEDFQIAWGVISVSDGSPDSEDLGSYQGNTDGGGTPMNVVPEPLTVILLGSGLAGLAFVASRRRREDDEAA